MKTWKDKVQNIYSNLEELAAYDSVYKIAARCGYDSVYEMWMDNPVIGGSVNPKDFGIAEVKIKN